MQQFLKRHWLVIVTFLLVGIIYIGPHLWFIVSNGDIYQGVPLMQSANEDFYISRIQEIVDGHVLVGSQAYFEYKDQIPLQPPTIEFLYALPTLVLGIPIIVTLTASKFILPILFFLLVYILIYQLLGKSDHWSQKLSAVVGALFITLGYDLVDYRTVIGLIKGTIEPSSWLIWTRPINPITGGILLFTFLNFLWLIIQNTKRYKTAVMGAGISFGFMLSSYFFSWGLTLSIMAMMGLFFLIQRNFSKIKSLIIIFGIGIFISSPYWYLSWQAQKSIWYDDSLLRNGLFYTHYPLLNKILLATLAIYIVSLIFRWFKNNKFIDFKNDDFFILASLFGGLFALNQQIITGIAIWPFHFVQYTIPLSIIAIIVVLHRIFYKEWKVMWMGAIVIITIASIYFGVYTQYKTYINFLDHNKSVQSYARVFDWFNEQEKDCVVLINGGRDKFIELSGMILSFTHCNQYGNTWSYSLIPEERIYHSYLTNLRFRGLSADDIEEYISNNDSEVRTYLFSNWIGLYDVTRFPDSKDTKLSQRIENLPEDYRWFLNQDLKSELSKYRLDFILSDGPLSDEIKNQLPDIELVEEINNLFIYKY